MAKMQELEKSSFFSTQRLTLLDTTSSIILTSLSIKQDFFYLSLDLANCASKNVCKLRRAFYLYFVFEIEDNSAPSLTVEFITSVHTKNRPT